jgi:hypothetical protein
LILCLAITQWKTSKLLFEASALTARATNRAVNHSLQFF